MANLFQLPDVRVRRSRFDINHSNKFTCDMGKLVPIYLEEVIPGDTFNVSSSFVVRTKLPFIRPIIDNLFMDVYFFYVPFNLIDKDFYNIFSSSEPNDWTSPQLHSIPVVYSDGLGETKFQGTVRDYLYTNQTQRITENGSSLPLSAYPAYAYATVWNDYFRDENFEREAALLIGSHETFNTNDWSPANIFGQLAPVCKFHDYFTSLLPKPQKGDAGTIDLLSDLIVTSSGDPLKFIDSTAKSPYTLGRQGVSPFLLQADQGTSSAYGGNISFGNSGLEVKKDQPLFNINQLRDAFVEQRKAEIDAQYGTRDTEFLLGHYGVVAPSLYLKRPEYLGGKRFPLNLTQVANTTESDSAQVSAFLQSDGMLSFNKSFTLHGYVLGVASIRQHHTYSQGLNFTSLRTSPDDFYDPVASGLGPQPVVGSLIFDGYPLSKPYIFGYQNAWDQYRFHPSEVHGDLVPFDGSDSSMWTLADYYTNAPTLNADFIHETDVYLQRAFGQKVERPFICDFYFKNKAVRPLSVYGKPSTLLGALRG